MANAKPVTSKDEVEVEETSPYAVHNDPRRPNSEPEAPVTKPKEVTVLDNGTTVEDY